MNTRIAPAPGSLHLEAAEAGTAAGLAGGRRRSVARLAAVQAIYQVELNRGVDPELVVREFTQHRLGHEIDGDRYGEADSALFSDVVREWRPTWTGSTLRSPRCSPRSGHCHGLIRCFARYCVP